MGLWTLMAPFALMALGTGLQTGTPDPNERTAIEQALIEHLCGATAAGETDAYHECLSTQLLQLRADFGRDLSRLSSAERRTLDSACSKIREARGREAYVACLSAELVSLRNRWKRASPAPSDAEALPSPSASAPPANAPAPRASSRSSRVWIGAALTVVFVAAGGGLLAVKARRRVRRTCRVCGGDVSDLGDLCQTCRHEAAEGVRRAAMARAEAQRAQDGEQRRQREREEEQRQQRARREVEALEQQHEHARQREEDARLRQEEEARQREEAARHPMQAAAVSEELFDPYVVLGVPREAGPEVIRAAYQEARAKYDLNQVTHLSNELQEHYKEKTQAVERAYQMLTA